ncbi:ROK family protein [Aureimonas phyllosphaerae]|uniref:ROK family protein n=1 Tax=Aureimonas phyllosphaerae TaxID=1166078 RepID=UPI003A5C298C
MVREDSFIGIDLGGTQLRVAAIDAAGRILDRRAAPVDRAGGVRAVIGQMEALIAKVRRPDTAVVGIGVPGAFDPGQGLVLDIPALAGWTAIPLATEIEARTGLPTVLENDAKVAALGEWRFGAGRGIADFAYLTISTGIGGAFVVGDRLVRGFRGLAGEVGHTRITDRSAPCSCGHEGCWEAVASGTALARAARMAVDRQPRSRLAALAGEALATGEDVTRAAREGCPVALTLLREEAVWLAAGLVNVQHAFSPERVVLGGGVSQALDLMLADIREAMRRRLLPGHEVPDIASSKLGDDAGLIGAAVHAKESR